MEPRRGNPKTEVLDHQILARDGLLNIHRINLQKNVSKCIPLLQGRYK